MIAENSMTKICTCGKPFAAELARSLTGNLIPTQTHCDDCLADRDGAIERFSKRKIESKVSALKSYDGFQLSKLPVSSQAIAAKVLSWEPGGKGIVMVGKSGTGKTFTTYALARRLESQGNTIALIEDHKINALVRTNDAKRESMLSKIDQSQIIVWDDFGSAKMTDATESFYFDLLERINKAGKPVIGSANFSGEQIKTRWAETSGENTFLEVRGERIIRRFRESCSVVAV